LYTFQLHVPEKRELIKVLIWSAKRHHIFW
jgi:hypothetical protein